jgi:hypothetical protein
MYPNVVKRAPSWLNSFLYLVTTLGGSPHQLLKLIFHFSFLTSHTVNIIPTISIHHETVINIVFFVAILFWSVAFLFDKFLNIFHSVPERMVLGEPPPDMFAHQPHPSSHLIHPADMTGEGRPHSPITDPMLPQESNVQPDNTNPAGGKFI